MMLVIRNGKIIDPVAGVEKVGTIILNRGKVIDPANAADTAIIKEIDAKGMWVVPGLIDMRAHLGEPGFEDRETFDSGLKAAARGGFTTVALNPATDPVCDSRPVAELIVKRAAEVGGPAVVPTGTLTQKMKGEKPSHMGELKEIGCPLVGDVDYALDNGEVMRCAMEYAGNFDLRVVSFPLDRNLHGKGLLREGLASTRLGMPATPALAEAAPMMRDLMLASYTGCPVHFARLSSRDAVDWLKVFRSRQTVDATADVTPTHLFFCDEDLNTYDSALNILPSLGNRDDMRTLRRAVRDGIIDVVCSDHLPRNAVDKEVEFDQAEPGSIGLETAVAAMTTLVSAEMLSPSRMVEAMSVNPARILGLEGRGTLQPGSIADVTIIDPEMEWTVERSDFASMAKISPFEGKNLTGKVVMTIAQGKVVYDGRD